MLKVGRQFYNRLILSDRDIKYWGSILKDTLEQAIFSPNFYFRPSLLSIIMSDSKIQLHKTTDLFCQNLFC